MTLIKYRQPDIDLFGRTFSDVMDEFFGNGNSSDRRSVFVPRTDVSESNTQYHLEVHLPGMRKDEISVDLEDGRLTITGERKFDNETESRTFHKVETGYGSFSRTFHLPDHIDKDSVNATYKDGILSITINKSEEQLRKQIEIN